MLRDFPLELLQPLTGALPAMRGAMTKAAEQTQRGRSNNYLAPFAGACVWGGVWGGGACHNYLAPFYGRGSGRGRRRGVVCLSAFMVQASRALLLV